MIYKFSLKNDSCKENTPLRLCAKKKRMSRKEGEPRRNKSLCALTTLRLCVNKKIRRGGPEILRDKQQRRGDAKK
jgi:hypothetical protein